MSEGGWTRWFRFNAVGAIGIVVQLAALWALTGILGIHYLAATFFAVELAIVHNFLWHERWTWKERQGRRGLGRLARFNLTTGLMSLVGNLALMPLLVHAFQLGVLPANVLAIAFCSLANFLLADRVVFVPSGPGQAAKGFGPEVALDSRARSGGR
ncbi:MAG: GtrA family protein [Acidobacteria bacterium]|nr:MAG: GtrA family protein [Acidobacteriota bacterium]